MTSGSSPILSIIIPTRNRANYAISAIRSVLGYPSPDFELIVHDNSDNDELAGLTVPFANDPRLRYYQIDEKLDMAANFSRAARRAQGTYVTFFGDDDGANPEIVDAAYWAASQDIDVLITTRPSEYCWPDRRSRVFGDRLAGRLDVRRFTGRISYPDPEAELRRWVRLGGALIGAIGSRLPGAYRGIAKRACMEQIHDKLGTYFPGPSPDLAIAISLACHIKKCCQVDYPLFVPGMSMGNAHAYGRRDRSELDLNKKPQFARHYIENWSPLVPALFSGTTIWGETIVQALKANGRDDLLGKFNVSYLHAKCLSELPEQFFPLLAHHYEALRAAHQGAVEGTLHLTLGYIRLTVRRGTIFLGNLSRVATPNLRNRAIMGLNDIEEAVNALTTLLIKENQRFVDRVS